MIRHVLLCVLLCAAGTNVAATDGPAQKDLARERVTLRFAGTPLTDVLPALAKSLGYELAFDGRLRALLTLQVENITAETALTAICESVGCRWRRDGARLVVETRTETFSTLQATPTGEQFLRGGGNLFNAGVRSVNDPLPFDVAWSPVDVQVAFVMLARMYDAQVEVAPALSDRKVALSVKGATLRQAFDAICRVAPCRWELVEQPKRLVRVTERSGKSE
ncbi:MAG: hypothetical protein NT151_11210 [Acidobacteria bacterium]|nr:hypothetical protein [Acidobacteriota bacterium]